MEGPRQSMADIMNWLHNNVQHLKVASDRTKSAMTAWLIL